MKIFSQAPLNLVLLFSFFSDGMARELFQIPILLISFLRKAKYSILKFFFPAIYPNAFFNFIKRLILRKAQTNCIF